MMDSVNNEYATGPVHMINHLRLISFEQLRLELLRQLRSEVSGTLGIHLSSTFTFLKENFQKQIQKLHCRSQEEKKPFSELNKKIVFARCHTEIDDQICQYGSLLNTTPIQCLETKWQTRLATRYSLFLYIENVKIKPP